MWVWDGKVVLITGVTAGIGRELTSILCKKKANVIGLARRENKLEELENAFSNFKGFVCDVTNYESVKSVIAKVYKNFGKVDVLINNAGGGLAKRITEHTINEYEYITKLNYLSSFYLIHETLPLLKKSNVGTIVNIITAGVYVLMKTLPSYGAAKAALHYASEILREELKEYNIKVISVYPGSVRTEFFEKAGTTTPKGALNPEKVANEIIKAIEKGKREVFIPKYLRVITFFLRVIPIRIFV